MSARRVDWFSFTVTWLTASQSLLAGFSEVDDVCGFAARRPVGSSDRDSYSPGEDMVEGPVPGFQRRPVGVDQVSESGLQCRRWEVWVEVEEGVSEPLFQHHLGEVGALGALGILGLFLARRRSASLGWIARIGRRFRRLLLSRWPFSGRDASRPWNGFCITRSVYRGKSRSIFSHVVESLE